MIKKIFFSFFFLLMTTGWKTYSVSVIPYSVSMYVDVDKTVLLEQVTKLQKLAKSRGLKPTFSDEYNPKRFVLNYADSYPQSLVIHISNMHVKHGFDVHVFSPEQSTVDELKEHLIKQFDAEGIRIELLTADNTTDGRIPIITQ